MKTRSSFPRTRRGFALVITMSLMALLLVLSVGLLSLSAVTLRTSSITDPQRIAQANARLGLMIAIGELQKAAGKDQRVTGTADLGGTSTGDRLGDGPAPGNQKSVNGVDKGLSAVRAGTRHWTGVWENQILQNTGGDPGKEIFTTTPSPRLVQWLVSGNENASSPRFSPDAAALAVGSSGKASDPKQAVVLVGEHTVGAPSNDTLSGYVVAPLVKITGDKTPGGYAWWVGDEGVKSRINTPAPYNSGEIATSQTMSAQRRGWETVSGFGNYPLPGSDSALKAIITHRQAELVSTSLGNGTPSTLNKVFHAATTDSFGVLSDTLHGGLRTDLTAVLAGAALPTSPIAGVPNPPIKGGKIIPNFGDQEFSPKKGPTWDKIKAFSDLRKNLSGTNLIVKAAASDSELTIAPVMLELRLLLGARVMAGSAPDKFRIHPCAKIAVVLANPYPYTLSWQSGLELEILKTRTDGYRPTCIYPAKDQPAYISRGNSTDPAVLTNTIFKIAGGSLQPGEARVYTINSPVSKNTATAASKTSVPLTPAVNSTLFNFDNAVFLLHTSDNSVADHPNIPDPNDPTKIVDKKNDRRLIMDVREDELTSQVNIELRLGSNVLRKFERFELDNANFANNQKTLYYESNKGEQTPTPSDSLLAKNNLNKPFGLQIYAFQLSQPGIDYEAKAAGLNGLRSTTMRTFTDFNLQAANIRKSIISYNPAPYFMWMSNTSSALPFPAASNPLYDANPTGNDFFTNLTGNPFTWGYSPTAGSTKTVLFSAPETLTSLAQLQHADLTADDEFASIAHQPGNAVGNSYATPFVKRELAVQNRTNYTIKRNAEADGIAANFFDISYRLNAALWDSYFFSTMRSAQPLNQQMVKFQPGDSSNELNDAEKAAAHLVVEGAFNINSTEKDAWKALLGSSKYLKHPADTSSSDDAFFPRSLEQKAGSANPPTGKQEDSFAGYRRLTNAQVDLLAEEIVKQVRLRGPFVSLAQFVNRALVPLTTNKELGRSGALQSAIDNSGVNIRLDGSSAFSDVEADEDRLNLQKDPDGDVGAPDMARADAKSVNNMTSLPQGNPPVWPQYSKDKNPGSVASIVADLPMLKDSAYRPEQGFRSTGIPGWLTQADVLQVIGPAITARSDTFRIRAYGEATDSKGRILAKAWCEAIVQRTPSYVDPSDADTERGGDLSNTNKTLGRKMQIVSFRWLSPNEI